MAYDWKNFARSSKMSNVKQSYWGNSKVPIPKQRNDDNRMGIPVTKTPKSGMMHFKEMMYKGASNNEKWNVKDNYGVTLKKGMTKENAERFADDAREGVIDPYYDDSGDYD